MSLVVNNNMMAANTARNLNAHYGRLATSTQRLSSGLRVNSAADDAAGLAIRELQRADIAALHQGARNANDAISMIQVADGSLGIIDEKLIRMKELAEQAATGTYDSTQRLMIESEYQAMASEITRIANATDFNGTKLLDGTLAGEHDGSGLVSEGKIKIHFGTGNDSAEDYYYVEIGEVTSQALGLGNASTWQDVQRRAADAFQYSLQQQIKNDNLLSDADKGELLKRIPTIRQELEIAFANATDPTQAFNFWNATAEDGKNWIGNSDLMERYMAAAADTSKDAFAQSIVDLVKGDATTAAGDINTAVGKTPPDTAGIIKTLDQLALDISTTIQTDTSVAGYTSDQKAKTIASVKSAIEKLKTYDWTLMKDDTARTALVETTIANAIKNTTTATGEFWSSLRETEKQKLQYAWGQAAVYNFENGKGITGTQPNYGLDPTLFTTGDPAKQIPGADLMFSQAMRDMSKKVGHMDFAGHTIETQEDAQMALDAINEAIVSKDKIRAHLGAAQNRLENTVSNLNIQAENLQAAESRISDVDVATEMTQFVRNQILTQSAVAMLSQANSLPQMAMQLIGG